MALPTIRIGPPEDWAPLDEAIRSLAAFRWVVFTSVNGVAAFHERLGLAGLDARSLAGRRVAAIGPETAEALRSGGIEADLVPAEYRAEGLVDALGPRLGRGDAVLLVRAAEARDVLPRELEARGSPGRRWRRRIGRPSPGRERATSSGSSRPGGSTP